MADVVDRVYVAVDHLVRCGTMTDTHRLAVYDLLAEVHVLRKKLEQSDSAKEVTRSLDERLGRDAKKLGELEASVQFYKKWYEAAAKEKSNCAVEIIKLRDELKKMTSFSNTLIESNDKLSQMNDALSDGLEKATLEADSLRTQYEEMQANLSRVNDYVGESKQLREENDRLQAALDMARSQSGEAAERAAKEERARCAELCKQAASNYARQCMWGMSNAADFCYLCIVGAQPSLGSARRSGFVSLGGWAGTGDMGREVYDAVRGNVPFVSPQMNSYTHSTVYGSVQCGNQTPQCDD